MHRWKARPGRASTSALDPSRPGPPQRPPRVQLEALESLRIFPFGIGRNLREVIDHPRPGPGQLFGPAGGGHMHQFHSFTDPGSVVEPFPVGRPGERVAARAVRVRFVQGFHHAPVAAAVPHLAQARPVGADEVRVAVVVLAREIRKPLAGRRPQRHEVERVIVLDRLGVAAMSAGMGATSWSCQRDATQKNNSITRPKKSQP